LLLLFQMSVNFYENYITVFITIFVTAAMFYLVLQNLGHATRMGIQDIHKIGKRIVDEWDKLEHNLNIKCEHFSLMTFCRVLFLNGTLFAG